MAEEDRQNARMLVAAYRHYLSAANEGRWDILEAYVADRVKVNGTEISRVAYVADLQALRAAHPEHRWHLSESLVDGNRLAVRLSTTRGSAMGFELAHYTWSNGRITSVWTIGT